MADVMDGAVLASTHKKARLLVEVWQGTAEVSIEALDPSFDVSAIELVVVDLDTDGAEEGDNAIMVDGQLAFVSVGDIEQNHQRARLARLARDTWALS